METTTDIRPKDKMIAISESTVSALSAALPEVVANAKTQLLQLDIPTTRNEEWKYTRTTRIAAESWSIQKDNNTNGIENTIIDNLDAIRLVFINGIFSAENSAISNVEGLTILSNQNISSENLKKFNVPTPANFFEALQQVSSTSALFISVEKNTTIKKPLHIVHLTNATQALALPSVFVNVESSASINITESFHGFESAKTLTIRGLHINVEANANIEFNKIQAEKDEQFHISVDNVNIANDGRSNFNTLTVDGGWIRNDLRISLDGQNIEANLNGFYLPRGSQLIDNHTKVDHRFPHCNSNELYKGILFDQSQGVFNGKVYVRKDAQKTNAYQNNANVLVGEDAQMNTKPELEIYADDVKCSHGTTTGQIDESAMFYLRARGLSEDSARKLLTTAFINDVLNKVENETVRTHIIEVLSQKGLLYN
jgi:Fe-S cluster assembly protein SufD